MKTKSKNKKEQKNGQKTQGEKPIKKSWSLEEADAQRTKYGVTYTPAIG